MARRTSFNSMERRGSRGKSAPEPIHAPGIRDPRRRRVHSDLVRRRPRLGATSAPVSTRGPARSPRPPGSSRRRGVTPCFRGRTGRSARCCSDWKTMESRSTRSCPARFLACCPAASTASPMRPVTSVSPPSRVALGAYRFVRYGKPANEVRLEVPEQADGAELIAHRRGRLSRSRPHQHARQRHGPRRTRRAPRSRWRHDTARPSA